MGWVTRNAILRANDDSHIHPRYILLPMMNEIKDKSSHVMNNIDHEWERMEKPLEEGSPGEKRVSRNVIYSSDKYRK